MSRRIGIQSGCSLPRSREQLLSGYPFQTDWQTHAKQRESWYWPWQGRVVEVGPGSENLHISLCNTRLLLLDPSISCKVFLFNIERNSCCILGLSQASSTCIVQLWWASPSSTMHVLAWLRPVLGKREWCHDHSCCQKCLFLISSNSIVLVIGIEPDLQTPSTWVVNCWDGRGQCWVSASSVMSLASHLGGWISGINRK